MNECICQRVNCVECCVDPGKNTGENMRSLFLVCLLLLATTLLLDNLANAADDVKRKLFIFLA